MIKGVRVRVRKIFGPEITPIKLKSRDLVNRSRAKMSMHIACMRSRWLYTKLADAVPVGKQKMS